MCPLPERRGAGIHTRVPACLTVTAKEVEAGRGAAEGGQRAERKMKEEMKEQREVEAGLGRLEREMKMLRK